MNQKICKNCGAAMPAESKFCTECGTSFPPEVKEEQKPQQIPWDPNDDSTFSAPKTPWSTPGGSAAPVKPNPLDSSDVKTVYLDPQEMETTQNVLPDWDVRPAAPAPSAQAAQPAVQPAAQQAAQPGANVRPDPRGAAQQYGAQQGAQYGAPYGAQQGSQFGAQQGAQQGAQYAAQQGAQYAAQQGAQYAAQQGAQYGARQGSQFGPQQGAQYGARQGSPYGPQQNAPAKSSYSGNQMITEDRLAGTELEPVSSIGWFVVNILMNIPVVNIVVALIWSFGGAFQKAKRSFARGWLMNLLLIIILCALAVLVLSLVAGSNDQPFTFFKDIGNAFLKPFGYEFAS